VIARFAPMPVQRRREPFDDPEWIFELKYDGFRALAFINGAGTKLVSRRGLEYRRFEDLCSEILLELNADDAVLDGEIVKLDQSGRPIFIDLMKRRGPIAFVAFDVLAVNGRDVRKMALVERKKALRPSSKGSKKFLEPRSSRGGESAKGRDDQTEGKGGNLGWRSATTATRSHGSIGSMSAGVRAFILFVGAASPTPSET
jgi:ATP-dependent DNA ligase